MNIPQAESDKKTSFSKQNYYILALTHLKDGCPWHCTASTIWIPALVNSSEPAASLINIVNGGFLSERSDEEGS